MTNTSSNTHVSSRSTWWLWILMFLAGLPTALPHRSSCTVCQLPIVDRPAENTFPVTELTPVAFQKGAALSRHRQSVEFPVTSEWINTKRPISMQSLKGKLVLLDFWTYCCINCMHVLPVLDQAEKEFSKDLFVVGVHTAKFETERDTQNIREAVLRYDIHHAVINDRDQTLWKEYSVNTWPTLLLIDPEGYVVWKHSGEIAYKDLEKVLKQATSKYAKALTGKPIPLDLEVKSAEPTPLRFPGKIITNEQQDRLFVSDSNHHRIVVSDLNGTVIETIGSGQVGKADGSFGEAQFNHPQGLALHQQTLYVADTENHLIRRVDLQSKQVTTVAGTGVQMNTPFPGVEVNAAIPKRYVRNPKATPLGSPWDLWIHDDQLYIAMAGPHQIWRLSLDGKSLSPVAGSGIEDVTDGPQLPRRPYGNDSAAFAQPSGLASDGRNLFVADSEGSSIRIVPFEEKSPVETLLGTSTLADGRLFTFGDEDGGPGQALFQHPLGLAYFQNKIFVADTYNNKIKYIDLSNKRSSTLVGSRKSGSTDDPPLLDEPSGLTVADGKLFIADTNNHRIRVWDLRTSKLSTLKWKGLTPPGKSSPTNLTSAVPDDAIHVKHATMQYGPQATKVDIDVQLELPVGWKLNETAPLGYVVQSRFGLTGPVSKEIVRNKVTPPNPKFSIVAPIQKEANWMQVAVTYYYCREDGQGVCLAETVCFDIPIALNATSTGAPKQSLKYAIPMPLGQ
ncbi:MAG: thioredoxin-like domain-containing protein [Pirellulales bacterium]